MPKPRPDTELFGGWSPTAVAFDCDGTLVDTELGITTAQEALFASRGLTFDEQYELQFFGTSLPSRCALFADIFEEPGNADAIVEELLELIIKTLAGNVTLRPGAYDMVARVSAAVPVAVVSNSPKSVLEDTLRCVGLSDMFPIVISADTVTYPKPDADPYLTACTRLGTTPSQTLAVEDSAVGLAAARAARTATLFIPSLAGQRAEADVILDTMEDPLLIKWVQTWR